MNLHLKHLLIIGAIAFGVFIFSLLMDYFEVPDITKNKNSKMDKTAINTENKQETKQLAEDFINFYVPYNDKEPLAYLEKIKPLVHPELFNDPIIKNRDIIPETLTRTLDSSSDFSEETTTRATIIWHITTIEIYTLPQSQILKKEMKYDISFAKDSNKIWKINKVQVSDNEWG